MIKPFQKQPIKESEIKQEMTINEENIILERCGRQNPFSTPEGYFEALPLQVMDRIRSRRRSNRAWRWAAAAAVAGIISTVGFLSMRDQSQMLATDDTEYMGDELDYSMIGNIDIAYYLSEAK